MSLSSLMSAAQTAVDMSQAAASAAEDAMVAAKLAKVHAQAALAAAQLALELDQKVKKDKETSKPITKEEDTEISRIEKEGDGKVIVGKTDVEREDLSNKVCDNCHLKMSRCLDEKFLLKVTDRTPGIRLKTRGGSWPESKLGKTCIVEAGDNTNVFIKWITPTGQKTEIIEKYFLSTNGDYAFQFCCKNLDESDFTNNTNSCSNCKMPKSRCLNGKPVLMSTDSSVGRKVKACSCGSLWTSKLLNKKATILGENTSNKINIRWDHTNVKETHYLITRGTHNFEFDCSGSQPGEIITLKDLGISENESSKASSWASYFVHRLPFRKTEKEHWDHAIDGEKHRIKFCVSENILLTGLGFLVAKTIDRVTITVSHQLKGRHDHSPIITEPSFINVGSSKSTVVLKLRKPLPLSCDKIYLLTVTLHGGASIVGHGGEEFISVARAGDKADVLFKFENYKEDRTDTEKGVIEKMYFDI